MGVLYPCFECDQCNSTYTAHYFGDNEDTDGDGVKDWFEYRMFGDLSKKSVG